MAYDCGISTTIGLCYYGAIAAKYHCGKAACEECAPWRRAQLRARGREGKPNREIVFTLRHLGDQTPEEACITLKKEMQLEIRAIHHELKKPPEDRWQIPGGYKDEKRAKRVMQNAREDDAAGLTDFQYFWTTERHKDGYPHIHMVARCPYIPWEWLQWQKTKRLNSPIVWIKAIRDVAQRVAYIVSYITKEEHRFGKSRRYAFSQKYKLTPDTPYNGIAPPGTFWTIKARSVHEIIRRWYNEGREVWTDGRRWFGWGDLVHPKTGEIWPRPAETTPYEFGVAWDDG